MPDDQRPHSPATSDSEQTLNEPRSEDGTPLPLSATVFGQTTAPSGAAPAGDRFGRYRILKKLGQGGMGAVFLAHDEELDRRVALKVPQILPGDSDGLERFLREARAAATLSHPNLCPVYDFGREAATPFLAMAYVEGEPLSDRLKQGPLPPAEAAELVRRVAAAVEEAHAKGVIHRDLKPSNVMLTPRGEPVVMDFGLARRNTSADARLTHSGMILGTPTYMPPEQAEGDIAHIGPRSDVYSLGVILYECLTGLTPFQGSTGQVIAQVLTRQPPAPSSLRPGLDRRLEAICLKAMARKPDDRYAGMRAFADALSGWLAASPGPVARRPRWLWVAAGLAVFALVLGVVLFLNTRQGKVRIEINDPKAVVLIDGEEVRIDKLGDPITLKPGKHGLVVKRGDVVVETRDFAVVRGDNPVLKITLEPPPPPRPPPVTADGFRPLFNGKDLTGWTTVQGGAGNWKVADGAITCSGPQDHLYTVRDDYGDFHLRAEVKINEQGNSGIYFRTGKPLTLVGDYEAQITNNRGQSNKTGSLYGLVVVKESPVAPDTWFTLEIIAKGKRIRILINGKETADYTETRAGRRTTGHIALQHHDPVTQVFFRKIEVRELKEPEKAPPRGESFQPLFNGKDLSGWAVDSGDREAWKVEEGELVVRANPRDQGWLMTTRDYGDFVLRLEFAYSAGANSGVALRAVSGEGRAPGAPKVIEVQLLDDNDPSYARLPLRQKTGALHNLALDRPAKLRGVRVWNTLEVEARGPAVRVKVNGAQVLQTDLSNFADQADRIPGLKRSSGRIGLQNWGNATMWFRKVEVKELSGK